MLKFEYSLKSFQNNYWFQATLLHKFMHTEFATDRSEERNKNYFQILRLSLSFFLRYQLYICLFEHGRRLSKATLFGPLRAVM